MSGNEMKTPLYKAMKYGLLNGGKRIRPYIVCEFSKMLKIPKKSYSIALSLSDKIDTLTGFFAIGLKPTSSKDPYALRRLAIGVIKIILENKIKLKLRDFINYSCQLYIDQNVGLDIKKLSKMSKDKNKIGEVENISILLYEQSKILDGEKPSDPIEFSKKLINTIYSAIEN